jgi:hypothetical protein
MTCCTQLLLLLLLLLPAAVFTDSILKAWLQEEGAPAR